MILMNKYILYKSFSPTFHNILSYEFSFKHYQHHFSWCCYKKHVRKFFWKRSIFSSFVMMGRNLLYFQFWHCVLSSSRKDDTYFSYNFFYRCYSPLFFVFRKKENSSHVCSNRSTPVRCYIEWIWTNHVWTCHWLDFCKAF